MEIKPEAAGVKRLRPISRKRRRTRSTCGPLFDKTATDKILSKDFESLTLLEKAHIFRTRFPEKFQARQLEIKERNDELIGIFKCSSFLEQHYKRIEHIREEVAKDEKERKKKPRIISVEIKFEQESKTATEVIHKPRSVSFGAMQPKADNHFLTISNPRRSSNTCELIAHVVSGDCLFNGLGDTAERYEKSWVSATLLPSAGTKPTVTQMKSENSNMNLLGQVRWETTFVFRGYSAEEMANKYIKFVVMGKTRQDKVCVGQAIISGLKAAIDVEDCQPRKPRSEETRYLTDAFNHPDKTVKAELRLHRPGPLGLRATDVMYDSSDECDVEEKQNGVDVKLEARDRNMRRTSIRRKVVKAENAHKQALQNVISNSSLN